MRKSRSLLLRIGTAGIALGVSASAARTQDAVSLRPIADLDSKHGPPTCVRFHPDGELLATTGFDGKVRLWSGAAWSDRTDEDGPPGQHWALAFSPDGKFLAVGSDFVLRVWSVAKGKLRTPKDLEIPGELGPRTGSVYSLAFTSDSKFLAGGCAMVRTKDSPSFQFWDTKRWELREPAVCGHDASGDLAVVEFAVFSKDGKTMASGGFTSSLKLWNAEPSKKKAPWREIAELISNPPGSSPPKHSMCAAFSPDDQQLLVGDTSGRIVVCSGKDGKEEKDFVAHPGSHVTQIVFVRSGERFFTSGVTIRVWSAADRTLLHEQSFEQTGADFRIQSMDLAPDGKTLATLDSDGRLRVFAVDG